MPGAWTWAWRVCTGNWLEMSGVVVAIGCIVYECLEHGSIFMQLLCLVIDLDVASLYVNFIQVCFWRWQSFGFEASHLHIFTSSCGSR